MSRMTVTGTVGVTLTVVLIACSKPSSPAETQAGAASDLNRPPHAGAAPAKCSDLPSAEDLKKSDDPASAWPGSQAISKRTRSATDRP